ncbi:MAG TPA: hypothetical protein VMH39_04170, partial [Gemmatimonadaceae bacterium]|nr:hypothetical protein [Gemmatimonadaceae bacterium]
LGSIVGAALAGLALLPLVGLKWLLISGASLDIAVGVALVMWHRRRQASRGGVPRARAILPTRGMIGPVVVTGSIVAAIAIVSSFDRDRLSSGVYRYGAVPPKGNSVFLFYRDGRTASVSVRRAADDTNSLMTLATNGKPDASVYPAWRRPVAPDAAPLQLNDDMGTQVLLPLITLAHAPRARTIAVIGEGSGMTSHFLLGSPNVRRLYTIEIEPEMVHASHVFYPANRRVFDDPRSRFVFDDARAFLSASGTRFDVILSEPSNPWVSGVSGLFTEEFYRRVSTQLTSTGVFAQWMHLYEISDGLVATVLAAIDRVFPSYTVFLTSNSDILIIASPAAALPDPDWTVVGFPGIADDLRRVVPIAPEQFEAMRLAGRALLHPYLSTRVVPNSDFRPALDLGTERTRFEKDFAMGFLTLGQTRLDLDAAVDGTPHGFGTVFDNPTTEIARVRDLALAAKVRAIRATAAPGGVAQGDSELRAVLYRVDGFERRLATASPPMDWRLWTNELATVEGDLHFGTAGIADERFYNDVTRYLDRVGSAPDEVRATVAFLHGLAVWNYAEAAAGGTVLLGAEQRKETWIPLDLLRDGVGLADLMDDQAPAARMVFMTLSHDSGDTATVSDRLLQSLVAARAAGASASSLGLRGVAPHERF